MATGISSEERKRTAIVTGGGRGIGKETAILLAKKGVNVVICSRTEEQINSIVQEIKKEINDDQDNNNNVIGVKCDVGISSQVDSLVESTINEFGADTIDILVNNAGVCIQNAILPPQGIYLDMNHRLSICICYIF
jgi:3-oxoacyl-[acyl-carrier protein] reductase